MYRLLFGLLMLSIVVGGVVVFYRAIWLHMGYKPKNTAGKPKEEAQDGDVHR